MTEFVEMLEAPCEGHSQAGTIGTGRKKRRCKNQHRKTVKAKKKGENNRSGKNFHGTSSESKHAGPNVSRCVPEAARILRAEGYIVGKIDDPALPFNLIGSRGGETLHVAVVRPREPVVNARDVKERYAGTILRIEPFWNSGDDNLQFWVFSHEVGLIRYQVFRGGIWNVETMQKPEAKGAVSQAVCKNRDDRIAGPAIA